MNLQQAYDKIKSSANPVDFFGSVKSEEELLSAYRSFMMQFHPDLTQDKNEKELRGKFCSKLNLFLEIGRRQLKDGSYSCLSGETEDAQTEEKDDFYSSPRGKTKHAPQTEEWDAEPEESEGWEEVEIKGKKVKFKMPNSNWINKVKKEKLTTFADGTGMSNTKLTLKHLKRWQYFMQKYGDKHNMPALTTRGLMINEIEELCDRCGIVLDDAAFTVIENFISNKNYTPHSPVPQNPARKIYEGLKIRMGDFYMHQEFGIDTTDLSDKELLKAIDRAVYKGAKEDRTGRTR